MEREPQTTRERALELLRATLETSTWLPTTEAERLVWAIRCVIILGVLVLIASAVDKSLWAWLQLLVIPAVIAAGGIWFNKQQRERELRIAEQRSQDEALQAYLDQMSQLLADKERPLHRALLGDSLSTVARARTLNVLLRLDGERKRSVLLFLSESNLIAKNRPIVSLGGADLRGASLHYADLSETDLSSTDLSGAMLGLGFLNRANLTSADLSGADLSGADLSFNQMSWADLYKADLYKADLYKADLSGAELMGAILIKANLSRTDLGSANLAAVLLEADLSGAALIGTNLSGARLNGANLSHADLTDAKGMSNEELERQASSLDGATIPNGQKYEEWRKCRGEENSGP